MSIPSIETDRTCLRPWRDSDLAPLALLNADQRVMEFMPSVLSREESNVFADRIIKHFDVHGFGFWALEINDITPFAGFVGLWVPRFESHFTPCVEIVWRLASEYWGHGYATEAARTVLAFGFKKLGLQEIVSYTVPSNARSLRVMEKIGLTRDAADDFDHPSIAIGHKLRRHVLYRAKSPN